MLHTSRYLPGFSATVQPAVCPSSSSTRRTRPSRSPGSVHGGSAPASRRMTTISCSTVPRLRTTNVTVPAGTLLAEACHRHLLQAYLNLGLPATGTRPRLPLPRPRRNDSKRDAALRAGECCPFIPSSYLPQIRKVLRSSYTFRPTRASFVTKVHADLTECYPRLGRRLAACSTRDSRARLRSSRCRFAASASGGPSRKALRPTRTIVAANDLEGDDLEETRRPAVDGEAARAHTRPTSPIAPRWRAWRPRSRSATDADRRPCQQRGHRQEGPVRDDERGRAPTHARREPRRQLHCAQAVARGMIGRRPVGS
jgi:hypothetical protein